MTLKKNNFFFSRNRRNRMTTCAVSLRVRKAIYNLSTKQLVYCLSYLHWCVYTKLKEHFEMQIKAMEKLAEKRTLGRNSILFRRLHHWWQDQSKWEKNLCFAHSTIPTIFISPFSTLGAWKLFYIYFYIWKHQLVVYRRHLLQRLFIIQ